MRITFFILLPFALFIFACANKQVKTEEKPTQAKAAVGPAVNPKTTSAGISENQDAKVICSRGQESRILHVRKTTDKGCELFYSTHSKDKPVAWSRNNSQHCLKIQNQIRGNLEKAQFNCVQETISSVTNLDEAVPQDKK